MWSWTALDKTWFRTRIIVHRPEIRQWTIDAFEVGPATPEAPQHVFARDIVSALFDPGCDSPERELRRINSQIHDLDSIASRFPVLHAAGINPSAQRQMGLRLSPIFVSFVLVSPKARVDRPKRFDTSRIVKADMVIDAVENKLDKDDLLETLSSITRFVSSETIEDIGRKLIALHKPATFNFAARFGVTTGSVMVKQPLPLVQTASNKPAMSPDGGNGDIRCRSCRGQDLMILHGKFGYYFKCKGCAGNTPIKIDCGHDGHKERIRKDARSFFRECADCRSSRLFFTNPE